MGDVFLSYSRDDWHRAKEIAARLETAGCSVWWDQRLLPGEDFRERITQKLEQARCVVVLWSHTSIRSRWVLDEAASAQRRGVLVPALLDPVAPPLGFGQAHAADLRKWSPDDPHGEMTRLIDTVVAQVRRAPPALPDPPPGGIVLTENAILTVPAPSPGGVGAVRGLAFGPGGNTLAVAAGNRVRLFQLPSKSVVRDFDAYGGSGPQALAFGRGGLLAIGSSLGCALVQVADGTVRRRLRDPRQGRLDRVAFDPDGKVVATLCTQSSAAVILWDTDNGELLRTISHGTRDDDRGTDIAFASDGTRFATSGRDGTARIWDIVTGAEILRLRHDAGAVLSVAFQPAGNQLASGDDQGGIRVWDRSTGECLRVLRTSGTFKHRCLAVAYSPDGRWLTTGCSYAMGPVWDTVAFQPAAHPSTGNRTVTSVAFDPSGRMLAAAAGDRAMLWSVSTADPGN